MNENGKQHASSLIHSSPEWPGSPPLRSKCLAASSTPPNFASLGACFLRTSSSSRKVTCATGQPSAPGQTPSLPSFSLSYRSAASDAVLLSLASGLRQHHY